MARGDGTGGAGESEKGESQIANISKRPKMTSCPKV